jgi:hypothetical protein
MQVTSSNCLSEKDQAYLKNKNGGRFPTSAARIKTLSLFDHFTTQPPRHRRVPRTSARTSIASAPHPTNRFAHWMPLTGIPRCISNMIEAKIQATIIVQMPQKAI